MMLTRRLEHLLQQRLRQAPAVVLLGPRQVGKTSLAREVAGRHPGALVLDLEQQPDLGIRRSLAPNKLPAQALDFLDPRPRV